MSKFAITLTKGNDRKVIYMCDDKDEALAKGNEILPTLMRGSGTLSCIQAEFDADNNIIGGKYKLIDSWIWGDIMAKRKVFPKKNN